MTLDDLKALLGPAGFAHLDGGAFGDTLTSSFTRPSVGQLTIGADARWESGHTKYVNLGLMDDPRRGIIGTVHRVFSLATLQTKLADIIVKLDALASQPDLLKCPDCGKRWVAVKEPLTGDRHFAPFLSCQGMYKPRTGRGHDVLCRGSSRKIPAIVSYP